MLTPPFDARCQGAVLAAAVGDALGHPVEFASMADIRARFGPAGLTDYALFWTRDGERFAPYTDDTQMAEAVLVSLLASRAAGEDLDAAMQRIARAFVAWAQDPQGGHRAPGNACLAGCRALARGVPWAEAGGATAGGCGSVMRAYPFGLVFVDDLARAEAWAVAHSRLTHNDPIALAACAAMAVGTALCAQGAPLGDTLDAMIAAAQRHDPKVAQMMIRARQEAEGGVAADTVFDRLRAWAAHEAIAAAVFLLARHPDDLSAALLAGANTPGDSDSIATLAGALVGARVGVAGLPARWREGLERAAALDALARQIPNPPQAA